MRLALFFLLVFGAAPAGAIELSLAGDRFWVVLASRSEADAAIGEARGLSELKPIVVKASNGVFAAVSGPYDVAVGQGRRVIEGLVKEKHAPSDSYLTKGASFIEVVWTPPPTHVLETVSYDGVKDVVLRREGLQITLSKKPAGAGDFAATATGLFNGRPAFSVAFGENPAEKPASQMSLVRLDPDSPMPQIVFTYFWQGAHCCTMTKIVSLDGQGAWHVIDGETQEGGEGYAFEDLEGKGFSALIASDQAFYYAFDSFAASVAPITIHRLEGDRLVDVTRDTGSFHRVMQDLLADESVAAQSELWHSNGFLAAWVADSILVGRGASAWAKMLTSYDHQSDFGPEKCTTGAPIDSCPEAKKLKPAFPAALKPFLREHGYLGAVSSFPVPYEIEPKTR